MPRLAIRAAQAVGGLAVRGVQRGVRRFRLSRREFIARRRRRVDNAPGASIGGLAIGGFPRQATVKLRYSDSKEYNVPASGTTFNVYRANGAFDPDLTGAGHQPHGFDQWMTAYTHFTVVSSTMQVRVMSEISGHQIPVAGCILKTSQSNTEASLSTLAIVKERPRMLGSPIMYFGDAGAYRKPMFARWSGLDWFGKVFMVGSRDYMGSAIASPAEQTFYTVKFFSIGGNDPAAVMVHTTIDYVCVLTEPKFVSQS